MSITPFGYIYIVFGLIVFVIYRTWLPSLLIVSASLHIFAIAIIGPANCSATDHLFRGCPVVGLGISPWLFTCVLVFFHLAELLLRSRRLDFGGSHEIKSLFFWWIIFLGWSLFSSVIFPFIFQGLPVYSLADWRGLTAPMIPLEWNRVNAVQAVSSAIIGMLMIYMLQMARDPATPIKIITGFVVAILISIITGALQRLQYVGLIQNIDILMNQSFNPSYLNNDMLSYFGESGVYMRLNWPFSEPSYSSVWHSGFFVGGLSLCFFSNYNKIGILCSCLGLFGLLNSMGGSGLAGAVISVSMLIIAASKKFIFRNKEPYKIIERLLISVFVVGTLYVGYSYVREIYPAFPNIPRILIALFRDRINGVDFTRTNSNLAALAIARDTWGLGAGLGSNRASSYLLSMLSNIGFPGLVLFMVLLIKQSLLLHRTCVTVGSTVGLFILGGTLSVFFGMALGIPDLNFPAWWIWLISGFGIIASRATQGPPEPNHPSSTVKRVTG